MDVVCLFSFPFCLYGFIGVVGLYGRWDVFCCKIHLLRLDWGKQMD